MLNVTIYSNGFTMLGHADYAKRGQDIVCSACTSAMYFTVEMLKQNSEVHDKIAPGDVEVYVMDISEATETALRVFNSYMTKMARQYPKHVKVFDRRKSNDKRI